MQPQHPSRRRLLGGLLAGLFGWLTAGKTWAQPEPLVRRPCSPSPEERLTIYEYDGEGNLLGISY